MHVIESDQAGIRKDAEPGSMVVWGVFIFRGYLSETRSVSLHFVNKREDVADNVVPPSRWNVLQVNLVPKISGKEGTGRAYLQTILENVYVNLGALNEVVTMRDSVP